MTKLTSTLLIFFISTYTNAQSTNSIGLFPTIDHTGTLNKNFDYSIYYFGAFNLINSDLNGVKMPPNFFVLYAEQALTYKINKGLSFSGSYVYERQSPLKDNFRNENRFYLQSTYKYNLGRATLKHRLRFDGRFIQNNVTNESPFTSRIRYLFGVNTPFNNSLNKLYFTAYNEIFINTYRSSLSTYSENWAYAAVGIKTTKSSNFEVGPLYIFWVNNAWKDLNNFYYLQLTWITNVNLSHKS